MTIYDIAFIFKEIKGSYLQHQHRINPTKIGERGETVIEVVVSCVVIGLVLTGAFISVSGSSRTFQSSKETIEALEYAEAQVEQLSSDKNISTNINSIFCYRDGSLKAYSDTNGDCLFAGKYKLSITKDSTTGVYAILAKWSGVEVSNSLNLYYKL